MTNALSELEKDLLDAVKDMKAGRAAKVHSVEELAARRRGRPPLPMVKVPVKIRLDADLLTTLRLSGAGWQTRINETLRREYMSPRSASSAISVFEQFAIELPGPAVRLKGAMSTGLMARHTGSAQAEGVYLA